MSVCQGALVDVCDGNARASCRSKCFGNGGPNTYSSDMLESSVTSSREYARPTHLSLQPQ
jgi:hypothetical protein